jgi:hypothetical protein
MFRVVDKARDGPQKWEYQVHSVGVKRGEGFEPEMHQLLPRYCDEGWELVSTMLWSIIADTKPLPEWSHLRHGER